MEVDNVNVLRLFIWTLTITFQDLYKLRKLHDQNSNTTDFFSVETSQKDICKSSAEKQDGLRVQICLESK